MKSATEESVEKSDPDLAKENEIEENNGDTDNRIVASTHVVVIR